MNYNFDKIINRRKTNCVKWDLSKDDDIIPLWLADMDFESPPPVIEALQKRVKNGVFGYPLVDKDAFESVIKWLKNRHNWQIDKDWIVFSPSVGSVLGLLVRTFVKPGEKVIVQPPVYYVFFDAVKNNGAALIENELTIKDGHYLFDFDNLINKIDKKTKMIILCNPHNPVGRVWKKNELEKLADICISQNILIVSDEIHGDLTFPDYRYTPLASISEKIRESSITCTAPSKTFNLAGLHTSSTIIPNPVLRKKFKRALLQDSFYAPNIFGMEALKVAYTNGANWLDNLLDYIYKNYLFLKNFINTHLDFINIIEPQGTYLLWLDFSKSKIPVEQVNEFLINEARVWLGDGAHFGSGGKNYQRINIATPRKLLSKALIRMKNAFDLI